MALRKFPYGYVMERGEVIVNDSEAEIIHWIFENRATGRSILEMARELHNGTDPYFRDTVKKAACKISSILYDARYIGEEGYPVILDKELFKSVQERKGKPWMGNTTPRMVAGRKADDRPSEPSKTTTYIPSRAVFEKEKALKAMLRSEDADAEHIRTAILDLASEKYDCIT